jgi:hypothetical protein
MTSGEIERAYKSPAVAKIRELIGDIYSAEEFGMYLALPRPDTGKSELELIHEGRDAEAIEFAQALADIINR